MSLLQKLKNMLPTQEGLQKSRSLWFLRPHIAAPDLFHLNRRSIAGGVAIGFGLAWIPFPIQMIAASALSIVLRKNIAVSIFSTLITNPLTMPAMYFFAYWLGANLLGMPVLDVLNPNTYSSFSSFANSMGSIWKPLLLGCIIMGISSSVAGYFAARLIGRLIVVQKMKERKKRHAKSRLKRQHDDRQSG